MLVTVTVTFPGEPTATLPKAAGLGEKLMVGATPVPVRLSVAETVP